ncbi:MAG TPA: penicillin acylase family protein, partial [Pyrinomonadaceae bacterium]|nr:penicillin acylase family protein [Pyrinomonadaceae bacterium]
MNPKPNCRRLTFTLALISFLSLFLASGHPGFSQAGGADSKVSFPGLQHPVTVRRDERGIPYISAQNDEDLYFGQGYATAADRLWQMDLLRRTARGELSEIFGNPTLEEDKRHRTFGFAQVAEAEVALAGSQARSILEAYARGVNAYIATLDAKTLPPEFKVLQYQPRPWTPADSLIIVKLFFESLSSTWRLDVMREALADLPAEKRAALMPEVSALDVLVVGKDSPRSTASGFRTSSSKPMVSGAELSLVMQDEEVMSRSLARVGLHSEALAASNNWVVSGKHTASGKPLLANDPHLAASAPPIWYLVHLSAPGLKVAGVTAPGLPGVIIGHNANIAWGFTNVGPDVQDLYIEKFDPANPRRYMTPAGWRDAEIRREEIKVRKGFTDSATDTVALDVTVTRHGPIVLERDGKRYALRWTALDPKVNNSAGVYRLNRARDWREFTTALREYTPPMQNIVYADITGNIGYYAAGLVPIRNSGDGSVPYDGAKDEGEWTGFIPFEKLPHLFKPPSGMVVTANQRIVGTDYPYFLTHSWAQPYRARRILDLLQQKKKITADDFRAILGDTYSIAAASFAREAAKVLKGHPTFQSDEKLKQTVASFESWNGRLDADSPTAPMVAQMRLAFRSKILTGALGTERVRSFGWANFDTTLDRIITTQLKDWLPSGYQTYADLFLACYQEARQTL